MAGVSISIWSVSQSVYGRFLNQYMVGGRWLMVADGLWSVVLYYAHIYPLFLNFDKVRSFYFGSVWDLY